MRRILLIALLSLSVASLGCISNVTPFGNIAELDEVDFSSSFKEGESCAWFLFWFLGPFGDMSVMKAAKGAGIRKAEFVDYRLENYLIAHRQCAKVYGK